MSSNRGPKLLPLENGAPITRYMSWKDSLLYSLSLEATFAPFLLDGVQWKKKSSADRVRGLRATGEGATLVTAAQRVLHLEMMLGQIANLCPIIARKSITDQSTSLSSIWQKIRLHLQFEKTGAHFLDLDNVRRKPDESPEVLFQDLSAFIDDCLLTVESGITHHGEKPSHDEEVSPTVENMIVFQWLKLLHPGLPALVKQRYATELRARTLASLKPEISIALASLLDELHTSEDVKVFRAEAAQFNSYGKHNRLRHKVPRNKTSQRSTKVCPICKATKKDHHHFLSACPYLPDEDRAYMTKARLIGCGDISDEENSESADETSNQPMVSQSRRVNIKRSPLFKAFYKQFGLLLILDTGAECNMIKHSVVQRIGATVTRSTQVAFQADGKTPLIILGETRIQLSRKGVDLHLEALVVEDMEGDILAGVPFMMTNDISVRPSLYQIIIKGSDVVYYNSNSGSTTKTVRRTHVLRAPTVRTTLWPGDLLELDVPEATHDTVVALEPRGDCLITPEKWPSPDMVECIGGKVRLLNDTDCPINLKRSQHVCQVSAVITPEADISSEEPVSHDKVRTCSQQSGDKVTIDPDGILPLSTRELLERIQHDFNDVFEPRYSGYNGAVGPFKGVVNMGPVQPPQRKGRIPQYSKDKLVELQEKCDELEALGVLRRPEDVGIVVEYLNPSFLVKKSNGSHRLVTAFADVAKYCKPSPSLMPDVESTLRVIACWKYLIVTDLTSAFYQIPLSKESLKYCGISTPFKGTRVYTRCAMGMPGSETALEELMCRVFGDMLASGAVAKLADDLYIGGNTPEELAERWRCALQALRNVDLKLSAKKTVVCPKSTVILGWVWSNGSIRASTHRMSTLSTCTLPETVRGLRSFVGAYKVLSRVIPNTAEILAPLEEATAGLQSQDKIKWNDKLQNDFSHAQKSLANNKCIVLSRPTDQLYIVTDGSVRQHGIGATLYVVREGKLMLAGFYSAKLRKNQVRWLPCEVEALGIAAAIKHFSPLIIQSSHQTRLLTDSKPCVQSVEKLCRGEFSTSPRVSSFLTTVSRYQVAIRHISGSSNILADFASRNAPECREPNCQICGFITRMEESVVYKMTVQDVISGNARIPYASRASWILAQHECSDLRRVEAHLRQGTRPSKKETKITDIKRYLNIATIGRDGLLVKRCTEPFTVTHERIIVPRSMLEGLLTALHIKLDHPSKSQLRIVFARYFYALDIDRSIERVCDSCHTCASLKKTPTFVEEQSTTTPPESIGASFAADVMKQNLQMILVVRETITSFTKSMIINNEQRDTLRSGLIQLCSEMCPLDDPVAVIRVDPAPGFLALRNDELLKSNHLVLEIGRPKNKNKNPIAERAIQELRDELLRQETSHTMITPMSLSLATARLNSRIRKRGLSAREMLTQRDQFTNAQLPVEDQKLINDQQRDRLTNHPSSERSKAPRAVMPPIPDIRVGELVYLYNDRNKTRARDRYIVVVIEDEWCHIRKFVGSQLRSTTYKVKRSDCYVVPAHEFRSCHDPAGQDIDGSVDGFDPPHYDKGQLNPNDVCTQDETGVKNPPPDHEETNTGDNDITEDPEALQPSNMDIESTVNESHKDVLLADKSDNEQDLERDNQKSTASGLRRSSRLRKRPSYLGDFVVSESESE